MLEYIFLDSNGYGVNFDGSRLEVTLPSPLRATCGGILRLVETVIGPVSNLDPSDRVLYLSCNLVLPVANCTTYSNHIGCVSVAEVQAGVSERLVAAKSHPRTNEFRVWSGNHQTVIIRLVKSNGEPAKTESLAVSLCFYDVI